MEIPEPPRTTSSSTQRQEDTRVTPIEPYVPLSGLPLAQRVEGIAATRPRNLGGEVAATLIAGSFTQMSEELRLQRNQATDANERAAKLQDDLGSSKVKIAVLEERLAAHQRMQTVKQIAVFTGTALLAVAIDLFKADLNGPSFIIAVLGVVLLGFGWITRHGGNK